MEKIKNKYEIILGFVTLIISFSALKEDLAKIELNLGYVIFTASQYFLSVVYVLFFCLYLYVLENIFRDTKIGAWYGWKFIIKFAFICFVFVLLTPILLFGSIVIFWLINLVANLSDDTRKTLIYILNIISSIVTLLAAITTALRIFLERRLKQHAIVEQEEIEELEKATKLYHDGYYSQSILETFKVLETNLYKELTMKEIRVPRYKISELLKYALKENILSQEDLSSIGRLQEMRNMVAHSDVSLTKSNADFALTFIRQLIKRRKK